YYLDLLLAEIAYRIGVCEWTIRCMWPEEVTACLESRGPIPPAIHERLDGCLYALVGEEEHILTGSLARELRQRMQEKILGPQDGSVLKGHVACRGKVIGPCKVIIRADDQRAGLEPGAIVVSESTDPDLAGLLSRAGGVLTEQGGVTSHAAIICRELGIPTIVGIDGLLDRVHDGDVVEVDAERGTVTPLRNRAAPLPAEVAFAPGAPHTPDVIGAKAYNLGVARSLGFTVPEYVLLNYEGLRRQFDSTPGRDGLAIATWALEQIGLPPDDKLAVRSSAVGEDHEDGSLAGKYRSLLNVHRDQLAPALYEFIASNRR